MSKIYRTFTTVVLFNLSLCLWLPVSQAQENTGNDIEEIIVIGQLSRAAVLEQITAVEDEIYRNFNANNGDRMLNINCQRIIPTGTHFSRRLCEPRFLARARQNNNRDFAAGIASLLSPEELRAMVAEEFDKLNKAYAKLIGDDPAFAEVVNILAALQARLGELQNP